MTGRLLLLALMGMASFSAFCLGMLTERKRWYMRAMTDTNPDLLQRWTDLLMDAGTPGLWWRRKP